MSIPVRCGQCGQQYTLGDALAGKRAKCKKCGAVMTIPVPSEPASPDASVDPLAGLGDDPLAGLSDWESAGDPLGPSTRASAPLASPTRAAVGKAATKPKSSSSDGEGIPQAVWITAAAAGGGLLLVLIVVLVYVLGGSRQSAPPAVAASGDDDAYSTPDDSAQAAPGETSAAASTDSDAPTDAKSADSPAAKLHPPATAVDDSLAWNWQPEPSAAAPENLLAEPLTLTDQPQDLFLLSPDVAQLVVSYARSAPKSEVLVQRIDLKTGQAIGQHSYAPNTKLLGASPDGTTLLIQPAESFATQETLQVWRWKEARAEQVVQWKPYEDQRSRRFAWAMLADASRVVTHHALDQSTLIWDADQAERLHRISHKGSSRLLPSPGGKYLVQHSDRWLRFFQSTDGKHVGSLGPLPDEFVGVAAVAWSRNGRSLAATLTAPIGGDHTVVVFDMDQGQRTHAIEVPSASDRLQWVGDQFLLAGSHLVSLAHEMTVWHYLGFQLHPQAWDRRAWSTVRSGDQWYLFATTVPSDDVTGKIGAFVAANTPVLQAGDSISLQVTVNSESADDHLQQKLTESFRAKLSAAGYPIAEGRPIRLQVNLTEEDTGRQLSYRTFGKGDGPTTLQIPDQRLVCKVAFVDQADRQVWSQSITVVPTFLSTGGGEGDLVTRILQDRWRHLDDWIARVRITKRVFKLSSAGRFGQSILQPGGERILSDPLP